MTPKRHHRDPLDPGGAASFPQLGLRVPAAAMRRFWTMLAHYAGGIWNGSEIGRSLGDAHTTARRHLDALETHPKLGASWESFAIEQPLARTGAREACYWRTQAGAELDLFPFVRGKRIGIEMKYADAPAMTKSLADCLREVAWKFNSGNSILEI